ncbi:MAG TPA: nitroreductase family deazaflavin-dependent oxidoreductase [Candidatus Binatia bacterium]|jgi:deazaflavin-dependent oxidoreductase (nitroreductase family)|nr:nitroreductase family deazaflavin-dependent oxidoreductase [Candidatus Binatia bacterium]
MPGEVRTRRWNDPARPGDGVRVLICRYRPRGVARADETWDVWWKDLSPSVALHAAYYGKDETPIGAAEYRRRFLVEMAVEPARSQLRLLVDRVHGGESVTLLCSSACTDAAHCHRTLVRELAVAGTEPVTRLDEATAREPTAHLTTTGRRSGVPRQIPMWFAASPTARDVVFLLVRNAGPAGWVANLAAEPRVELEIGGRCFAGIARVLGDDGEAIVARRLVQQKYRHRQAPEAWPADARAVAVTLFAES